MFNPLMLKKDSMDVQKAIVEVLIRQRNDYANKCAEFEASLMIAQQEIRELKEAPKKKKGK